MRNQSILLLVGVLGLGGGCIGGFDPGTGLNNGGADAGQSNGGGGGDGTGGGNGDGTGGGGGGKDAGSASTDVASVFRDSVAPILGGATGKAGACGGCHGIAGGVGPAFLEAKPDMLTSVLMYPALIGATPETSRLLTKGVHEGPGFAAADATTIGSWITLYNANKPKPSSDGGVTKPTVAPFAPVIGANTVDLAVLDSKLAGQSLTFTAKMIGSSLQLSQITVKTAATLGIHIVHPLWSIWNAQGTAATPDPIDSFSNLDQTVAQNTTAPLGPGSLLLPNFATGEMINVVFTVIAGSTGGGVVVTGCKAPANFQTNVRPLLAATCYNCHGANPPTAGLAMNAALSAADMCANLLGEVNLTTPANSVLLQKPNPAVAGHNGGNQKIQNFAAFQTAVTNWINLEK